MEKEHYSANEDIRHVRMDGIDFWIPRNYNFGSYNSSDLDQVAVALQLLLPDFEPRTEENIKEFTEGGGHRNRMTILMREIPKEATLEFQFNKRIELTQPHEDIKAEYGFDRAFQSMFPDDPTVIIGAQFYAEPREGRTYFIECRIGKRIVSKGCTQRFMYSERLMLQISYSSKYLPDWRNIERNTIELMKQFQKKPQIGEPI